MRLWLRGFRRLVATLLSTAATALKDPADVDAEGEAAISSLYSPALAVLRELLQGAGFTDADGIADELIRVADAIPGYTEEGATLYPELIVTTSMASLARLFPVSNAVQIGDGNRSDAMARVLKSCAPLARSGWIIFLEVGTSTRYGVFWGESTELSPTSYAQLVGDLYGGHSIPVLYIRGLGRRRIEVRTPLQRRFLALSLQRQTQERDHLEQFAGVAVSQVIPERQTIARAFVRKLVEGATRETHGCIITVVEDSEATIGAFRTAVPDGKYLPTPIDLMRVLDDSDEFKNREASTAVRAAVELVRGMVSQDGITVFSTSGRVIAFNAFVPSASVQHAVGGARKRAFGALCDTGLVWCCLALSHDGAVTYWEKS